MTEIEEVEAPPSVSNNVVFSLKVRCKSDQAVFAGLSVQPPQEFEIEPERTPLPAAPGGATVPVEVKIRRKTGSTSPDARILVRADTTGSTFTRVT